MSDIVLKFANDQQYKAFLKDVKDQVREEVLNDLKGRIPQSKGWTTVRGQIEKKMRGEFNNGCGHWYNNQQGLYATFRLAFNVARIQELAKKEDEQIQNFHDELFSLIEKYRGNQNASSN
ncbi:hypothetical protein [Lysinibacillus sphaericus]|uniref:hypothetical protein n=1 Tax=Lysinibacillus sphaericus TaxID=1421 RepID=UPI003CFF3B7C